jgi:hypothetical protein
MIYAGMGEERFTEDTAGHQLTVARDDGLYRHLRFRKPGTSEYWFDLVTWPGTLVIDGDMGTYVFSRTVDMFGFFGSGEINPQYWEQKIKGSGDVKAYSEELFRTAVAEQVDEWITTDELDAGDVEDLRAAVRREVLTQGYGEDIAQLALSQFEWWSLHDPDGQPYRFTDTWEWELRDYTPQYLWCCHAITYGIREYLAGGGTIVTTEDRLASVVKAGSVS